MDYLSTSAIIFLSFFTIVYAYYSYAFSYWKSKRIPYVKPSFPFGNISGIGRKYHCTEPLKKHYDMLKSSGAKIVGFYLFTTPAAVVLDLELMKNILNRDFLSFDENIEYFYEINELLSARLPNLRGEKWKTSRAKISPAFTYGKIKAMFQIVVKVGERLCRCLNESIKTSSNDKLEMFDWCKRFVADSTSLSTFGIESNSLKDPNSKFIKHTQKLVYYAQYSPLFLAFLNSIERLKIIPSDVSAFLFKFTADSIEYRRKNAINRGDFMDTLIGMDENEDPKSTFTFNEIAAHAMTFFIGTLRNQSTTLAFCLYELSINSEIQTKARLIIEEAFKKYDGQFTYEMMMNMPYIDQIIEETLRKYPISITTRKAKKDYAIPGTDIVIDKGTQLIIPIHAIHHDPDYYPNPEKFDPNRFRSEEKSKRDPITWLSFGSGPRFCVGQRFAMMQARVAIVLLLKNFEFSLDSTTAIPLPMEKANILFSPQDAVNLKVKPLK